MIWVLSLGWEDPLLEKMATHSSILTWEIPWTWNGMEWNAWNGIPFQLFK